MLAMGSVEELVIVLRAIAGVVVLDTVLVHLGGHATWIGRLTQRLTVPLYRPFHRFVPPERAGVDFSPMLVIMLLIVCAQLVGPPAFE